MTETLADSMNIAGSDAVMRLMSGTASYEVVPAKDKNNKQVWEELKQPWSATPQGRLAIRAVSRGVLGAAFYAWGTQKAIKDMEGYDPANPQNGLQRIARVIDKVIGAPMIRSLNKMGLKGDEIVSFRPSHHNGERTLGEDAIFNTFDFAMASAGDTLGREIIALFDPNVEKKWRGADGKIDFPQALKSLVATGGRIFEAQAEDWFVAVPYTFQQKFQRKLINEISPGFETAGDTTLHGSSFKLDKDGKVIGTYAWEGVLDLQGRFTGYNFGTAIFRDLSKAVKTKTKEFMAPDKRDGGKPMRITPETLFDAGRKGVRGTVRYFLNRAVKTVFVMTPSIPLFSLLRIPQSKHRGTGIMPDGTEVQLNDRPDFNPYDETYSNLDAVLNPLGKAAHKLSTGAAGASRRVARMAGVGEDGQDYAGRVADSYVNAAFAYTPYIYAKNEFAHHWDNPDMDKAVYRAIDGMFSLNVKEMKAGVGDIRDALKFRDHKTVKNDERRAKEEEHGPTCHFFEDAHKQDGFFTRKYANNPVTPQDILDTPQNKAAAARSRAEEGRHADRFKRSENWQEYSETRDSERQPARS